MNPVLPMVANDVCAEHQRGLPLAEDFGAGATFAWRNARAITIEQFLGDVDGLAKRLPPRRFMLNACADRYRFTVAFCAALMRGQINLLPPNQTAHGMAELCTAYPDVYCITETTAPVGMLEAMVYPDLPACHDAMPVPNIAADQLAAIIFTSGSTGAPLPQQKTWGALVRCAKAEARVLGLASKTGFTLVGTVPPQHMYGLESTVFLAMQSGVACAAARPFYPADVRAELALYAGQCLLVTTPVHLRALLADPSTPPKVDVLLSATAPLSPQLAIAAEQRFEAPLFEIYGCTEAGAVAMRRPVQAPLWQALPGLSLRQQGEQTSVTGGHVSGEVVLADVIELRDDHHFLLHGRTADLVNIAGKRTSLAHLNHHLNSIAGVRDGVFIAPLDASPEQPEGTARLSAFVVAPELSVSDILTALRERIDQVFLPRPLHLVDSLPRNPTGKLTREALRALLPVLATPIPRKGALTYSFALDHPTAAGHFPGNPIIPGALLLSAVVEAISKDLGIEAMPCTMNAVKFLSPLRPGERLVIAYSERTNGAIDFSCEVSARTVMSGQLQCHANR